MFWSCLQAHHLYRQLTGWQRVQPWLKNKEYSDLWHFGTATYRFLLRCSYHLKLALWKASFRQDFPRCQHSASLLAGNTTGETVSYLFITYHPVWCGVHSNRFKVNNDEIFSRRWNWFALLFAEQDWMAGFGLVAEYKAALSRIPGHPSVHVNSCKVFQSHVWKCYLM